MGETTWFPQKGLTKNMGNKLINQKLTRTDQDPQQLEYTKGIPAQQSETQGKQKEARTHVMDSSHYDQLVQLIDDRWNRKQAETTSLRREGSPEFPGSEGARWKTNSAERELTGKEATPRKGPEKTLAQRR